MMSKLLKKLLPAPMVHIPTPQEIQAQDARLTKEIIQQHAEGSVLLAAGRFEMPEDLFAEEDSEEGDT